MFQTEEQDKTPEELTEVERSNLPEKEFKVMFVKIIKELGRQLILLKSLCILRQSKDSMQSLSKYQ